MTDHQGMADQQRPVFVVGAARSGTTWVQCLICAMDGFYSCPETHFFDELLYRGPVSGGYQLHRPRYQSWPERIGPDHLDEIFCKSEKGFLRIPSDTRDVLMADASVCRLTTRGLLERIIEVCSPAGPVGRRRWVEKTPIHASYLEQIFNLFPEAQVICVVRVPEGVLGSAFRTFGTPACIAGRDYWLSYRDVQRFLDRNPRRRCDVLIISYEQLLDGDGELSDLQRFLGCGDAEPAQVRREAKRLFNVMYGETPLRGFQRRMSETGAAAAPPRRLGFMEEGAVYATGRILRSHLSLVELPAGIPAAGRRSAAAVLGVAFDLIRGIGYLAFWRAIDFLQSIAALVRRRRERAV